MQKKTLSIFLAILMVLSLIPAMSVSAASLIDSGKCGEQVTYKLYNDGKLEISGTYKMSNFYDGYESPFYNNPGIKNVVVNAGVSSIGNNAFKGCTGITSVSLPSSVSSIGDYAFEGCTSLTSVFLPSGASYVGSGAFKKCSSLVSVTLPDSISKINDGMFYECSELRSIAIPASVEYIGSYLFYKCENLESVSIPSSLRNLTGDAFIGCSRLNTYIISKDNPYLSAENGILFSKDKDTVIKYPENRTGAYTLPNTVTTVGENAFMYCSGLTSVTIPEGVTTLEDSAFASCTGLSSVIIPSTVSSVGSSVFSACTGLTSVTIREGVKKLDYSAFRGCSALKSLILPASVEEVGIIAIPEAIDTLTIKNPECKLAYDIGILPGAEIIGHLGSTAAKYADDKKIHFKEIEHTKGDTVIENNVLPTCTKDGSYDEVIYCTVCNKELSRKTVNVPALGHKLETIPAVIPTCTEGGNNEYYHCTVCDKYFKDADGKTETTADAEKLEALGHSMETVSAIAPTCTTAGNNEYYHCTVCDKYFKDADGKAETTADAEKLEALGHKWDEGKITKEPTVTEEGVKTYTCTVCGEEKTEAIPKLAALSGDTDGDGKVTAADARTVLRASVNLETLTDEQKSIADMDGDGKITASDARLILRKSVNLTD